MITKKTPEQSIGRDLAHLVWKLGKATIAAAGVAVVGVGAAAYYSGEWAYKRLVRDDYSSSNLWNLGPKTTTRTVAGYHTSAQSDPRVRQIAHDATTERRRDSDLWSAYRYTRMNTAIGMRISTERVRDNIKQAGTRVGRDLAQAASLGWFLMYRGESELNDEQRQEAREIILAGDQAQLATDKIIPHL